jgi:sporulation protein YlmC with PRC-barrel domain
MLMYVYASQLVGRPVMSIQAGGMIAKVTGLVVTQEKLILVAFECFAPEYSMQRPILSTGDVREITEEYLVVDSAEDIGDAGDIVRMKALLEAGFSLVGMPVVTQSGVGLGIVSDYSLALSTKLVHRVCVRPPLLRRILTDQLMIDRQQIVEVQKNRLVVRDAAVVEKADARSTTMGAPADRAASVSGTELT